MNIETEVMGIIVQAIRDEGEVKEEIKKLILETISEQKAMGELTRIGQEMGGYDPTP